MGQLPKDPQQLAQDILAGRVSIQQLQAEQARRRANQEVLRQNMRTRGNAPASAARASAGGQVVKPNGKISHQAAEPSRSQTSSPAPVRVAKQPSAATCAATGQAASSAVPAAARPSKSSEGKAASAPASKPATAPRTASQTVRAVMNNPQTLRSVFVLSELLDKPLSLRNDPLDRF